MKTIDELTKRLRHDIDAGDKDINQDDVLALCDAIHGMIPALDLLQKRLEDNCKIRQQEGRWCLFDRTGEGITSG